MALRRYKIFIGGFLPYRSVEGGKEMKVMVCYDGSNSSRVALESALDFLEKTKPDIIILMVAEDSCDPSGRHEESSEEFLKGRHDELHKIATWVAGRGFETDAILATGEPRKMIIEAVDSKSPEMVVLGRCGMSNLEKVLLGTVTSYVVENCRAPVVII